MLGRKRRSVLTAITIGVVASMLSAVAAPASAHHGGSYTILRSNGTFLPAANNLWPSGVDDAVRRITFPFVVKMWGTNRTWTHVSSNGNLQFGNYPSAAYHNECLPSSALSGPVVAVYWDDILIRPNAASGDGVFTKTYGTSPNRKFVISWRGVEYSNADEPVRAEVIFYEGKTYFDTIYAAGSAEMATVGIQNYALTRWTERTCNTGGVAISTNDQLRFSYTP